MVTGEEINNDEVATKNYQNLSLNDYHLGKYIGNRTPEYYLISASDVICVRELMLEDRFKWFIEKNDFFKAWEIGAYAVNARDRLDAGLKDIGQLIDRKEWGSAASHISTIFSNTNLSPAEEDGFYEYAIQKWQEMISVLIEYKKVDEIAPLIPHNPKLDALIYDSVLEYYLDTSDFLMFAHYIHLWHVNFFTGAKFEDLLEERVELQDSHEADYRKELVYLYLEENKYMRAIPHLLKMKDTRVLDILLSQNLMTMFLGDLVDIVLLPYDSDIKQLPEIPVEQVAKIFNKSLGLLVQNRHAIPMNLLTSKLSHPRELRVLLFLFMERTSAVEPLMMAPYEDNMVELYSEYKPDELLRFLKSKSNYNVEKAIEICSANEGLYNELIYLWGKIGEAKKALSLIIDKLDNPQLAIQFVKDSKDTDLWEFLVSYSMDKSKFIKALLEAHDEFGNTTVEIIKKVPSDMAIDGLQSTLGRISKENSLSLSVNSGIFKIIDDETKEYATEFLRIRSMGKVFEVDGNRQ